MGASARLPGYLMAISGGILWAVGGACGQYLFRTHAVTTNWLIPYRLLIAGVLFLLLARRAKPGLTAVWREKRGVPRLLLYALLGVASSQLTFYGCIEYANVAFSTVMCYICPIFILLFNMIKERRPPKLYEVLAVALVVTGVLACATHWDLTRLIVSPTALLLGLLCALTAAINTLLPLPLMDRYGLLPMMGWGMLAGGLVTTLVFRPWQVHPVVDWQLFLCMAVIIIGGTILAFALYMAGVRRVGSLAGNVLSSVEPMAAVVISILFLNTTFTGADFTGFVLILSMVPVIALGQRKFDRKAEEAHPE